MTEIGAETFASPLTAVATVLRLLSYGAALLAAGGMLFVAVISDRRPQDRPRLARAITVGAAVAALATVAGVGVQAMVLTGRGLDVVTDRSILSAVLASTFGTSAMVRVVALAVLALAVEALWRAWALALGLGAAVAVSGSFLLTGHTVTAQPGWLAIASGLTHTLAAAAWFGGLVLLGVAMRTRRAEDDAAGGAALVSRFSTLATGAVIVVSIAGALRVRTVMAVNLEALDSGYGLTLVAKVALVGVIFVVAGYNHRYLVPAVRAAEDSAWQRLRTTVRVESLALFAVIAMSAVLANLSPPGPAPVTAPAEASTRIGPGGG